MSLTPISSNSQITSYNNTVPLLASIIASSNKLPKSSSPIGTNGTVQSNTNLLPAVTIYTEHSKIQKLNVEGVLNLKA